MTSKRIGARGRTLRAALIIGSLGLFQCERSAVYDPKLPDHAHFQDFHLGTYSTKLDEEKETEGTIFQTTLSFDLERKGGGFSLRRKLDTLIAKGYHKLSMPHELEKKIDLFFTLDSNLAPTRIDGYDSLKPVLARIQQRDDYRKQLLAASDTAHYKAEWRDWWRMENFLPRGKQIEAGTHLPVDQLNKNLETLRADSARFDGPRPRLHKSCLDFSLYYHRNDSLSLLMEQFYFSNIQNRKYRKYPWHGSVVNGILQYSVDKHTGLPCFHSKSESSDVSVDMKEDKTSVPVHLYRYEEDIFQY